MTSFVQRVRKVSIHPLVWVALIVLGAALIRIGPLNRPGSLSFDEAWSVWVAHQDLPTLLQTVSHDKHPPLFYLVLFAWIRLAGDSEFSLRIIPAIAGALAPACLYLLGKTMFDTRAGLLAAVLGAVTPLQVFYAQEARMYPQAQLFLLLSVYFFWQARAANRRRDWILFSLTTALMVYTHYLTALLLSAEVLLLLADLRSRPGGRQALRAWVTGVVIAALPALVWLPVFFNQVLSEGGAPDWIATLLGKPGIKDFGLLFLRDFLIPFPEYPRWQRLVVYLAAALLPLAAFVDGRRIYAAFKARIRPARILNENLAPAAFCLAGLVFPAGAAWLVSQFEPMFVTRYFLPFAGLFYLLLAWGARRFPLRLAGSGLALLISLLALGGSLQIMGVQREANWKETAAYIEAHWQPGDVVVIIPPANWIVFEYYTRSRIPGDKDFYHLVYPNYPASPSEADLSASLLQQPLNFQRLWLIEESGTGLSAEWTVGQETVPGFFARHFPQETIPAPLNWNNSRVSLFRLEAIP